MNLFSTIRNSVSVLPQSLLGRTTLTLAVSSFLIAVVSTIALNVFVIEPISERSADDEAALLVLSAQTWVELPPQARPYFELELAQSHDLIISVAQQSLPPLERYLPFTEMLQEKLRGRLALDVSMYDGDDLVWVDVPMAGYNLQIGFSPDRRDVQLLYVAIVIAGLGAGIVFLTSLLIVRRIARPLVQVGNQAEAFRGLADIEPARNRTTRAGFTGAQLQHHGRRNSPVVSQSDHVNGRYFSRPANATDPHAARLGTAARQC